MFLMCRTLGHAWFPVPSDGKTRFNGDPLWLRCERCDTERHDEVAGNGELLARHYDYEPDYRHAFDLADHVAPSRAEFRRLLIGLDIANARWARQQRKVS